MGWTENYRIGLWKIKWRSFYEQFYGAQNIHAHAQRERERLVIGVTSFRCFAKYPHSEHTSSCDGLRERERERERASERESE